MKRPRVILLVMAGAAALFLAAAIVLPYVVDVDSLRPQAEQRLAAALGRHVSLGPLRLSLWRGLALRAESLTIGEPLGGSAAGTLLVRAGPTSMRVAWLPLSRKSVELRSITASSLSVTQDGRPLVSDAKLSSRLRIATKGRIETEGSVTGRLSVFTASPQARAVFTASLQDGSLEIPALKASVGPLRIDASGRAFQVFSRAPRLALSGVAQLARSQVKGRFDVVAEAGHPTATFDLDSTLLDAGEIMAASAAFARSAPAPRAGFALVPSVGAAATAPVSPSANGASFVRTLAAEGDLRAGRCVARGLELTGLSTHVALDHGLAQLDAITFALYGGTSRGSLTVHPFEPRIPFSLDQTADGVAIAPLIAALAPAQAGTAEGKAALAVRLSGEAGGAGLLPSLIGAGRVAIEDGTIASFGVLKQVQRALEIAGAKGLAKDETAFDRLSANFDLRNGTADTKDLQFRSRDLDADGTGSVGLGGALMLDVLASFSKSVSDELVAKTHALSIRQGPDGRLSVPLQIRGTIEAPRVQLDLSKVINEGVLKQLKQEGTKSFLKKLLGR